MRFHATRGAMSVGESAGGLPPDAVVEREDAILRDSRRVIETFHERDRFAMLRIALAPCSPFSVSRDLMRESATLARELRRPAAHASRRERERRRLQPRAVRNARRPSTPRIWAGSGTTCGTRTACSSTRPGSRSSRAPAPASRTARARTCGSPRGIAPVRAMLDAGVPVGLGVDGSASNDGAAPAGEARQALLLQRVGFGPAALSAREALRARDARRRARARPRRHRLPRAGHGGGHRRVRPERRPASRARGTTRSRRWCSARRRAWRTG